MFENKIDTLETFGEITLSHHTTKRYAHEMPTYHHLVWIEFMIYFTVAAVIFFFSYDAIKAHLWKIEVYKKLPNYFDTLKISDCEEIVEDEEFFREKGGFRIISDGSLA